MIGQKLLDFINHFRVQKLALNVHLSPKAKSHLFKTTRLNPAYLVIKVAALLLIPIIMKIRPKK